MKILLSSIGTRGDIEPFIALGKILEQNGHEIIFSFPEQFKNIISTDIYFHSLSPKIIELIESKEGKIVMGKANMWKKLKALIYLYKEGQKINKELVQQQHDIISAENPDLIIHNSKCSYPILWSLQTKKTTILLSPVPFFMHGVKGHAHIGFPNNLGNILNKLSYKISNYGLSKTIFDSQKIIFKSNKYSRSIILQKLLKNKIIFSISPSLFPRPDYWRKNAQVLGFHERDNLIEWNPESPLLQFLKDNKKILFLTFGSMVSTCPEKISKILFETLEDLKIPTIVNTASGGLIELSAYKQNPNFYFVQSIPYEWIFKRVHSVIHHGGSGTTHTALKYGCSSLIIPHVIDQFGWNRLIAKCNLGPKGVSINKISSNNIKELISSLYQNDEFKSNALSLSKKMLNENLKHDIYNFVVQE
jgi:UDP:flavonoid glycosyltransferase YjiC (YdhE family)